MVRLVFEFFKNFSRMEYALKASQKYLKKGKKSVAQANWQKFIKHNNSSFKIDEINDKYLFKNPPKVQKVDNSKKLIFKNHWHTNKDDLESAVEYIKTIRNNLFHGGKATSVEVCEDNDRNRNLLKSSIEILDYIKSLDSDVNSRFNDFD